VRRDSDPPNHVQRQLVRLAALFCRVFYERVEVQGLEHLPARGPVLVFANHANALADAIVLVSVFPGLLRPMARSGLFLVPVMRRLLLCQGAVAVFRRGDPHSDPERNREMFGRCFQMFTDGAALLIFPEGQSHSDPHLHPFKTGAARLVLGARDANAEPAVLPVGLTFTRKGRFRGSVLVQFGAPVPIDPELGIAREHDVRELTAVLERAAAEVTLNTESWETLDFLQQVERFVALRRGRYRRTSLGQRFRALRRLLEMERALRREHPEVVDDLRARLAEFQDLCREFGVRDSYLTVRVTPTVAILFIVRTLAVVLIALPIAVWGWLNAVVPFLLTRHLARALSTGRDQYDTAKMFVGALVFALFWGVQAWWVYDRFGAGFGAAYLVSLPIAASVALTVARERRRIRENLRAFFRVVTKRHVRDALVQCRSELERDLAGYVRRLRRRSHGDAGRGVRSP
jgi:1-acyl-sn-glycerol-3-phosphate acyltransferase